MAGFDSGAFDNGAFDTGGGGGGVTAPGASFSATASFAGGAATGGALAPGASFTASATFTPGAFIPSAPTGGGWMYRTQTDWLAVEANRQSLMQQRDELALTARKKHEDDIDDEDIAILVSAVLH